VKRALGKSLSGRIDRHDCEMLSVSEFVCHPAHREIYAQAMQVHNYLLSSLTSYHTLFYGLLDKLAPGLISKLNFFFYFFISKQPELCCSKQSVPWN